LMSPGAELQRWAPATCDTQTVLNEYNEDFLIFFNTMQRYSMPSCSLYSLIPKAAQNIEMGHTAFQ